MSYQTLRCPAFPGLGEIGSLDRIAIDDPLTPRPPARQWTRPTVP